MPCNAARALELLRLGTQKNDAAFREAQEEAIRHVVENRGRLLVVNSDFNKGGTWTGAVEQLEKFRFGPVFVRVGGQAGKGNAALVRKGALPWPEPTDASALEGAIVQATSTMAPELRQDSLPLMVEEPPARIADR
ncbi:MAG: hypothetical protein HY736_23235 [Verrucomicrobia bacterium]|nr:hypothetical protein [Verrucomicrobiota bacterium]